jgi:hypothetical protein
MAAVSDLAHSVLKRTQDGKLSWSELSPSSYIAQVGLESIIIERQGPVFVMRFVNTDGRELEKLVDEYELLADVYERARRQALHVDEKLSHIKRALDNL